MMKRKRADGSFPISSLMTRSVTSWSAMSTRSSRRVRGFIEFVREVMEEKPFDTITREDDTIGMGYMQIDQPGFPGYKMFRYRNIYKGGKVIDRDKWTLNYPPVVEYVRMGVNPDPNLPAPKEKNSHMPKPAKGSVMKIVQ